MAKKTLTQAAYDVNNIQNQPDQVVGQATALKTTFDKTGSDAKIYNNTGLLVELSSETPNATGANAIGSEAIMNVGIDNVGDELKSAKAQIDSLAVDMLPPGTPKAYPRTADDGLTVEWQKIPQTIYNGADISAYGDSLTWGQASAGQSATPWPLVFEDLTECNMTNSAIAGSTMAEGSGYGWIPGTDGPNAFCNRVDTESFAGIDQIFVMYGTNDYGFVIELGDDNPAFPKTTFKGALNYALDKLTTTYPSLKITMLTPLYADTSLTKNDKGYTMSDYVNAIIEISSNYNIPVINLHKGFGINANNIGTLYWDALHPEDATYVRLGEYIANSIEAQAGDSLEEIQSLMPIQGGDNLLKYGDIDPTGTVGIFTNALYEKGVTFSLAPAATKSSSAYLRVIPGETLYLTFYVKSLAVDQIYEVDLFSVSTLTTRTLKARTGEILVQTQIDVPLTANPATDYQLRFTNDGASIDTLDFSSIMLTRSKNNKIWSAAKGEEDEMWFNAITLTDASSGGVLPSYRKNGNGNVQFLGLATVAGATEIGILPVEARPQSTVTTTIIATDGTVTFAVITAAGALSVGTASKTYDLNSIPQYFAGLRDIR
jgi:lysophospholipase L1-like esterase